jgi:NADPH:quinone reductase-like Zn-dependent oxidoreductase
MKAVQVNGYGGLEQLVLVEREIPKLKPHEVLVKVKACAINNTEIWMREGAYGDGHASGWKEAGVTFPRIPGSDIAGTIVSCGEDVDASNIGRHVVLFPFTSSGLKGEENLSEDVAFIGSEWDGGYAQYVSWPASLCFDMPLNDFKESCVFSVSGLTAWHMCSQVAIKSNDIVLVTGASGGVGIFNVQIAAKIFNAQVIALVGDLSVKSQLKRLGATHVLSYKSSTLIQDILDLNNKKVDVVLDVVGDALFSTCLDVLKTGGKMCISGSIGGVKTHLDLRTLYLKHISLYGSVLGTIDEYKELLEAVKNKKIVPVIDQTFDLIDAQKAQAYFKKPGKLGKVVLIID